MRKFWIQVFALKLTLRFHYFCDYPLIRLETEKLPCQLLGFSCKPLLWRLALRVPKVGLVVNLGALQCQAIHFNFNSLPYFAKPFLWIEKLCLAVAPGHSFELKCTELKFKAIAQAWHVIPCSARQLLSISTHFLEVPGHSYELKHTAFQGQAIPLYWHTLPCTSMTFLWIATHFLAMPGHSCEFPPTAWWCQTISFKRHLLPSSARLFLAIDIHCHKVPVHYSEFQHNSLKYQAIPYALTCSAWPFILI